jgi:GNAT superfamily N-acetyltransferase
VLEQYRPEHYPEVRRFAARLDNWFYVRLIIRSHTAKGMPGACYIWREQGRTVAFQAVAWLNPDDAWLWGMRVDPAFKNRGVATRFTRAVLPLIRQTGRSWVGLNTLDRRRPAPTIRVMEKLGMKLDSTDATDVFWRRPQNVPRPRLRPASRIFDRFVEAGRQTYFYVHDGWLWARLLPGRRTWFNRGGFTLDGVPIHLTTERRLERGRASRVVVVNLLERPPDFRRFVARVLALVPARKGHLVVDYPVEWARDFRAAARAAIRGLRVNRGCWLSAWRIYSRRP